MFRDLPCLSNHLASTLPVVKSRDLPKAQEHDPLFEYQKAVSSLQPAQLQSY
jgi:hypothetical protein